MTDIQDILNAGLDPSATPPELLRRVRYANLMLCGISLLAVPYVFLYLWLGLMVSAAAVAVGIAMALSSLVWLRRGGEVSSAANLGVASLYLVQLIAGYQGGGLDSLDACWWLLIPPTAVLLNGARTGAAWTALVILTMVATAGAHWMHLVPARLPGASYYPNAFAAVVGALLAQLIVSVGFLSESDTREEQLREVVEALKQENHCRAEAEREARQALATQARFLAMMSHEIRTPLNGVLGMNQLLQETTLDADQRQLVDIALGATRSLQGILNDILDFSKLDAGKVAIETVPFDLITLVRESVALYMGRADKKRIFLESTVEEGTPEWVYGDPTRLRQVLLNLLSNAVKFTEVGGVALTVTHSEDGVAFAVSDTGIGISPAQSLKLFEPFTQAEDSTTRKFGGTGLGLSICRELVELMGGELSVDSEVGQGSHFTFELALAETTARSHLEEVVTAGRSLRILLAEDNPVNQVLAGRLLAKEQHEVVVVDNGLSAVEAVSQECFDLVLMDMLMPVMGGLEATRKIRALPGRCSQIPIVALTANAMTEDREACMAAGMNDFIPKPFDFEVFRATLAKWGSRRDAA